MKPDKNDKSLTKMLKKITYILFLILALILSSIFFLSNFGLKTERFNRNISDQLKKNYPI